MEIIRKDRSGADGRRRCRRYNPNGEQPSETQGRATAVALSVTDELADKPGSVIGQAR